MDNNSMHDHEIDILHVTSVHPWNDIRIYHKECKTLAKAYRVGWLYPEKDLIQEEDGIQHFRIPPESSRAKRMLLQPARLLRQIVRIKPKACHFHDPELIPLGCLLRIIGYPVTYDAHEELDKQVLSKPYLSPIARRVFYIFAKILMGLADKMMTGIIGATPTIQQSHQRARQAVLVQNYPILSEALESPTWPRNDKPVTIIYAGGITRIRGLVQLVQAMELVRPADVRLVLLGPAEQGLLEELQQLPAWHRVDYYGKVDRTEMNRFLADASIGIVPFLPEPNHVNAQPNKMFEYMSAGLALAISNFDAWTPITDNVGGVSFDPLRPESIAKSINSLLMDQNRMQQCGQRGWQAVQETYNWQSEAETLLRYYQEIGIQPAC